MTCEHCGAALPAFALFCGECGRSVAARPSVVPGAAVVDAPALPLVDAVAAAAPEIGPEPEPELRLSRDSEPATEPARVAPCTSCGLVPEPDDLYCAECGSSLSAQTRIIERIPALAPLPSLLPTAPLPAIPPASSTVAAMSEAPSVPPAPAAAAPAVAVAAPAIDDERTRLVPRGTGGARFVLQFSTGESYTVLGSGLAGRNPRPEPGEYVDHLVTIVDPGRSVSKTHFEFGQEAGTFWVADRHSGNGTVIREPGAEPRPCTPGNRYPVVRGTRIDIGEQFVVVS
ncbi:FHA domain-containing protein [Microcella frigidaquae]|uniref:FHA domain-containing protein n=1 Tax=Microcella frigidaquae TaxID=424758 RepID=A0A840X912_9MICO|nr:hypothetical protein [Microcella frigidaquae]NHN44960.1 FHA domain-containing protein [Microcella frigidaquae]